MISTRLYSLYWFLRYYKRNSARKRKYYRYIEVEKKRLLAAGVDAEELRLLCRYLANPQNEFARRNLANYQKTLRGNHSFVSASVVY